MPTKTKTKPAARSAEPKGKSKPSRNKSDKIFFPTHYRAASATGEPEVITAADTVFNHVLQHYRQQDSRAGEMTRRILRMKQNGDDPQKLSALCRPIYAAVLQGILDTFKEDPAVEKCSIEINLPLEWRDAA